MTTLEHASPSTSVGPPLSDDRVGWHLGLVGVGAALVAARVLHPATEHRGLFAVGVGVVALALFALGVSRRGFSRQQVSERPESLLGIGLAGLVLSAAVHRWWDGSPPPAAGIVAIIALSAAGAGLAGLLHERVRSRAWDLVFESSILGGFVGLVIWALVAVPTLRSDPSLDVLGAAVAVVVAVLHLASGLLSIRLVMVSAGRPAAHATLAVATSALLLAHLSTLRVALGGTAGDSSTVAMLQVLGFGLWGASSLHPSMGTLAESVVSAPTRLGTGRLVLLVSAVLAGPVLLVVGPPAGEAGAASIAVAASALSLLALGHLVRLVQEWSRLEHQVGHDDLTGLPGRALFNDSVSLAIEHSRRSASPLAVMFLDLDRFKIVNDSLGHAAGNVLLQGVARRLRATIGPPAVVARLSGDEFAVLLPDLSSRGESERAAAAVLEAFAEPHQLAGKTVYVSSSIGIAHCPADGIDATTLLRNADAAMYRAKDRGRNTYTLYTADLHTTQRSRLSLEAELHTAIERGQLVLHYQPKVDLVREDVSGAEVLVRWQHPTHGLLGPDEFIPLAEETGLIGPIGEWVLEEACRQARAWQDGGFPHLSVAVNISARQFQLGSVESVVASALRRTGLDPSRLELELTETLAFQQPELISATLKDLKAMGVRTSIDDFGTGYSGLSYLERFPVDAIKIDKSFVKAIDGGSNPPIVLAVIALAKGLDLDVVAEGVETDEQLAFLRRHGVTHMQGFLFSEPVSAERFETLLMLESISPGPGRLRGPAPTRLRAVGAA